MPKLLTRLHPAMAYGLAADPHTAPTLLYQLAVRGNELVRTLVAQHRQTNDQTLLLLAGHASPSVDRALLTRSRLPEPTRTVLLKAYVRKRGVIYHSEMLEALTRHRSLHAHDLVRIYRVMQSTPRPNILLALASHPSTPCHILTKLARSPTGPVADALIKNRATPGPLRLHLRLTTDRSEEEAHG